MAWVEKHRNSFLVRERVDGKKRTLHTFDDKEEAQYFARIGKPIPVTSAQVIARLHDSMGSRSRSTPTPRLRRQSR